MEIQLARYLSLFHSRAFVGNQFSRLIKHFGSITQLQANPAESFRRLGLSEEQISLIHGIGNCAAIEYKVNTYLHWAEKENHFILSYEDKRYPPLLREIDCPPPLLFVVGRTEVLGLPQLALVGSRKGSSLGRQNAFWMSQTLARCGLCVCSGMAAGIDSQAHFGALSIDGNTVAVMGTGVDRIYPANNRKLAASISEAGALISEFPLGAPPVANHFPRRNRIISGMSLGVLVVEAAVKSGTLITARTAMEQNREVFAIPGAINNPLSRGCHQLIREGAKLVETPEDVLEELQIQFDRELWLGAISWDCREDSNRAGRPSTGSMVTTPTTSLTTNQNRRSKKPGQHGNQGRACQEANQAGMGALKSGPISIGNSYQPSALEARILAVLDGANCHLDVLIRETQMNVQDLMGPLLQLEGQGLIQQVAGRYSRL